MASIKNQLLEFDEDRGFMQQLLITEKARKSLIKPKIEANGTGLNSSLIDSVKNFLEDARRGEPGGSPKSRVRAENGLIDPNPEQNEEHRVARNSDSLDKEELGVEFDLLMYEADSESEESDEEGDQESDPQSGQGN